MFVLPALSRTQTPTIAITAPAKDTVLFDFDGGNYDGWTFTGTDGAAFGDKTLYQLSNLTLEQWKEADTRHLLPLEKYLSGQGSR